MFKRFTSYVADKVERKPVRAAYLIMILAGLLALGVAATCG